MSDTGHPITPPADLIMQWLVEWQNDNEDIQTTNLIYQAARWGADQELEACCHLLRQQGFDVVDDLRATRRPKPPSLKEQALEQLDGIRTVFRVSHGGDLVCDIILRALEQLDD